MKTISNRPWIVFGIILLVEILLALSPFIPGVNKIVSNTLLPSQPLNVQIVLTGIYSLLLTLFFGAGYWSIQEYFHQTLKKVEGILQEKPEITVRRDDQFHQDFLLACKQATSQVFITNLSPTPTYFSNSKDRQKYLDDLIKEIKARPQVQFRRLIRYTKENLPFAEKLMTQLSGLSNANLALIRDSDEEVNPLALSVQIIDDHDCWIVALDAHERQTSYRDIHIRDKVFANGIYKYYMRLWQKADVVLQSGIKTTIAKRVFPE